MPLRDYVRVLLRITSQVLTAMHEGAFAVHDGERTGGGYGSCQGPRALAGSTWRENFYLLMCLFKAGCGQARPARAISCEKSGHYPESKRESLKTCRQGDSLCLGEFILAVGGGQLGQRD